jgi:hypothetical protein
MSRLPENWHKLSLGALWDWLNDRHPTPQVVIEAVMHAVRQGGLSALQQPETKQRLLRCDRRGRNEINRRIETMLENGIIPYEPAA